MIYLIIFFLSFLLLYVSEYIKNKYIKKMFIIISILIPCIIAGLRFETIGTDVTIYLKKMFLNANVSNNLSSFLNMKIRYDIVSSYEFGFTFLVYILTHIFHNFQIVLFFIEVLILFPIYKGLKILFQDTRKISVCMLVYYFLFYNTSFNLMRQCIAISFVFLGTCYLIKNKNILKFFLLTFLAYFFHKSSLLSIFIFLIYYISSYDFKRHFKSKRHVIKFNEILLFILSVFCFFLVVYNNFFSQLLSNFNLEYYTRYVNGKVTFTLQCIVRFIPFIIFIFFFGRDFKKLDDNSNFYITTAFFEFIFNLFSSFNVFSSRIALYFSIFYIVSFPKIAFYNRNKLLSNIVKFLLLAYLIIYWYYYSIYCNGGETFPYIFYFE